MCRLSGKHQGYRAAMLAIAMLASLTAAADGSDVASSDIVVEMTGTPGTRFSARWELTRSDGGRRVIKEQGGLPTTRYFQGTALMIELTVLDKGHLQLEVQKDSNRLRSSADGAGGRINISVQ